MVKRMIKGKHYRIYIVELDSLVVRPNRKGRSRGAVNYPLCHLQNNFFGQYFYKFHHYLKDGDRLSSVPPAGKFILVNIIKMGRIDTNGVEALSSSQR